MEQQIIEQVTDNLVAQFNQSIVQDPAAAAKFQEMQEGYKKTGMYRVIMMETAKMMSEIVKLTDKYAKKDPKWELLANTMKDWQQKASFASTSSLNSVAKDGFLQALKDFQRMYVRMAPTQSGEMVPTRSFVIDGIYVNDLEGLVQYMVCDALSEEYLREFLDEADEEDVKKVFTLMKENTKMIIFPTCQLKKMQALFPDTNLYDAWIVGLPLLMDKVFAGVVERVRDLKEKAALEN